jgi:D-glycero-alpha-D-manno-heptose 1-phosphate guanylyltransferase
MGKNEVSFSNINMVVLAGGLGTRLRPLSDDCPKSMMEINHRPFLEYLLDQIRFWGGKTAILCTGYLGDRIYSRFGHSYRGIRLVYSRERSPMGTGGALRLAFRLITSKTVLVVNGDSYCAANLGAFLEWHLLKAAPATVLLVKNGDARRFGRVEVGENGVIGKFEEKTGPEEEGWINAGMYLFQRDLLSSIPADRPVSLEKEMFPLWSGQGLFGFQCEGEFIDIGVPESYVSAKQFFSGNHRYG